MQVVSNCLDEFLALFENFFEQNFLLRVLNLFLFIVEIKCTQDLQCESNLQLQNREAHSKDIIIDVDSINIKTKHMRPHIGV